jgi:hypothetical protein
MSDQWGIIGGIGRDNKTNMNYSAGIVLRF